MASTLTHQLRKTVLSRDGAGLTDEHLLACFIEHKDEDAFAALVRRHGPLVWGVCRRHLNHHDAEDAFQATFLVLARRAASIVSRPMVANWLYGVARTTALRAKVLAAKRRLRERQVAELPEPEAVPHGQGPWRELLDQELSRLPDKYRAPIVLCDLEERSIKEAARQLGWPQGTVAGRLARGRKMLRGRLARHGLAAAGGVLSQKAVSACVPAPLQSSTIKAATLFAAGQAATAPVAALTEGVLRSMMLTKLKMVTVVLVLAAIAGGVGLFYRTQAAEPTRATESQPGKDEPAAEPGSAEETGTIPLPSSPMPGQALVHLDKGHLVVRTLDVMYEPTAVQYEGKTHTSYQKAETLRTMHYDTGMVKVYDVKGTSIDRKALPDLLKKETVALVSADPHAADPLNLRLFKEGTLLFVLPAASAPPAPPNYYVPTIPPPAGPAIPPPAIDGSPEVPPLLAPPAPSYPRSSGQGKKP
ncbi:MAG TPA: RNA polymerase sigma factor [Gemmataceae bacterium]|nr:RNA polymerase sigma factor [Gemmataceae bacterium]